MLLRSDLLPLMFACGFNGAFERINQNLQNMSPGAKSVEWTMNKTTSDMSNLFCITGSENDSGKAKRINSRCAYRAMMKTTESCST